MKSFWLWCSAVCLPVIGQAFEWGADVAFTAGYRHDELRTKIEAFDPPGTLIIRDSIKADNIDVFEIGVQGRTFACDGWFLRGFANLGLVSSGRFRENAAFPVLVTSFTSGNITGGNTRDYSAGLGYLFDLPNGFRLGPVGGYSYDYLRIKMRRLEINDVPVPILNNLSYNMRWQGPWVGVDSEFCMDCISLTAGYEYHWSHWRANWLLDGPDIPGVAFSDKRTSRHAYGNVVYLNGVYSYNDCLTFGLGLKYQNWRARHGREVPQAGSFAAVGLSPDEVDEVPVASWQSMEVQLSIGYRF